MNTYKYHLSLRYCTKQGVLHIHAYALGGMLKGWYVW